MSNYSINNRIRLNEIQKELKQIMGELYNSEGVDKRGVNVAKTSFDTGFLWAFNIINSLRKFKTKQFGFNDKIDFE